MVWNQRVFRGRRTINKPEPNKTKRMEMDFSMESVSENTKVPANMGIAEPSAALKGIINKARPRVNAI